jgi:site-specific recombinase XerD
MSGHTNFGALLERFFTQRLMQQRQASAHTIASYRDTFKMLLQFVHKRLRKAPSALALDDIDAPLVMAFLDEMERARGITARTRNLRLTAVHSFFRFAAFEAPTHSAQIQRVLASSGQVVHAHPGAIPQSTGGRRAAGGAGPTVLVGSP